MFRSVPALVIGCLVCTLVNAQTMMLSTTSNDYEIINIFSDVDFFTIDIEINAPLAPGVYNNPEIISVDYQVRGDLVAGTPSEFPSFDLQRSMTGAEFYAQGSSLSFEIAETAVFGDGVQAAELVGSGIILTFNAREVDNGRFHPALLELSADGTGRIQNSNNVPTQDPLVEVNFGAEYITDLMFDTGNTTLITEIVTATEGGGGGGGGVMSPLGTGVLIVIGIFAAIRRQRERRGTINR
ncbi:MAG: hypothetical protein ACR2PS_12715 [Pseudomonadales bacterium]